MGTATAWAEIDGVAPGLSIVSGSFDPTSISGCILWLDGDDPAQFTYSSGVVVSQWNDKSGSAHHVSQATGSRQPSRNVSVNGRTALSFDGGDRFTNQSFGLTSGTTLTVFAVYRDRATTGNEKRVVSLNSGAEDWNDVGRSEAVGASHTSTTVGFAAAYRNGAKGVSPGYAINSFVVVTSLFDGTNHTMYADGAGGTPVASTGTWNSTWIGIGGDNDNTCLTGDIAEVVVYTGALNSTDRATVWAYLKAKWGTA